ncbi:GNAT family N-acetyltransferase, partial [bacterium AH-315-N22]|nr:GNAT family N-acetyltransferase [bacterium AH-315-N22]
GAGLLKGLEERAKEMRVSRFQLLADRSNNGGLRFYQKQNWQKTELICLRKHLPTGNRSEE